MSSPIAATTAQMMTQIFADHPLNFLVNETNAAPLQTDLPGEGTVISLDSSTTQSPPSSPALDDFVDMPALESATTVEEGETLDPTDPVNWGAAAPDWNSETNHGWGQHWSLSYIDDDVNILPIHSHEILHLMRAEGDFELLAAMVPWERKEEVNNLRYHANTMLTLTTLIRSYLWGGPTESATVRNALRLRITAWKEFDLLWTSFLTKNVEHTKAVIPLLHGFEMSACRTIPKTREDFEWLRFDHSGERLAKCFRCTQPGHIKSECGFIAPTTAAKRADKIRKARPQRKKSPRA